MKKEVFIAIIIGFGIGLIITYGIYTAQTAIKNRTNNTQNIESNDQNKTETEGHNVHIVSPEIETVSPEPQITLSGTTTPNSYIVILTSADEYITKSDQSGSFASEITLEAGANFIGVTSISPEGTKATAQTIISHTTANLNPDKQASESANTKSDEDEQ